MKKSGNKTSEDKQDKQIENEEFSVTQKTRQIGAFTVQPDLGTLTQ